MPTFDADAWLAAHEPWTVKLGGRVYRARPVSVVTVMAFDRAIRSGQAAQARTAIRRLLRAIFPWRPRYLVQGDPVVRILALDEAAQQAMMADFFESVTTRFESLLTRMTPGNGSGTRTAPRPPAAVEDLPSAS